MYKFFVAFMCFAAATAVPLNIFKDEDGKEYLLIPLTRTKRDLTWGLDQNGYGLGQQGSIWSNDNHQFDGSYGFSKGWDSHGFEPDSYNGHVDYTYKPSDTTAFVDTTHTPGWGTDVNAGLKYNIVDNKDWSVDLTGQYGQHFDGPAGTSDPNAGVYLNVKGKL